MSGYIGGLMGGYIGGLMRGSIRWCNAWSDGGPSTWWIGCDDCWLQCGGIGDDLLSRTCSRPGPYIAIQQQQQCRAQPLV